MFAVLKAMDLEVLKEVPESSRTDEQNKKNSEVYMVIIRSVWSTLKKQLEHMK